jgi:hypothetical protein
MATMTRDRESIAPTTCLLLAFELGQRTWKLGFSRAPPGPASRATVVSR